MNASRHEMGRCELRCFRAQEKTTVESLPARMRLPSSLCGTRLPLCGGHQKSVKMTRFGISNIAARELENATLGGQKKSKKQRQL
jgi:hypothetical protein